MARMLYLRDIEVDVHVRCRACGHEGVLPRANLQRRFGPNYPVLSIAPHYRCSKCDSRDTESRPAPPDPSMVAASAVDEAPSLDGPLAALQGLLDAVRIRDGDEDAQEELARPTPKPAAKPTTKPAEPDDTALEQLIADGPPAPESGRRPLWEPISLADMAARLETDEPDPEPEEPATVVEDDPEPLDATIAALRGMIDAGDEDAEPAEAKDEEEDALPPVFSPKALVRSDFDEDEDEFEGETGFADELPDDDADEEPSEEEILAFAIRDPEKAPPPPPPPWERERGWEREPDDQPLDKTIAALRDMVEEAAAEPAETEEDEPLLRPRFSIVDSDEPRMPAPVDEAPKSAVMNEDETDEPPTPRKSAQELEMEEALKALRALVEADDPDEEEHRPLSLAEIARQVEEASDEAPEKDPGALTPTDIYAPGERTPWDDGATTLDLVDEVQDDEADDPKSKSAKPDPSPLDKTIAALRGMLELDGKRGR